MIAQVIAGVGILLASVKFGSYVGTMIGGPAGYIIRGPVGIGVGMFLDWLADEIKELIF